MTYAGSSPVEGSIGDRSSPEWALPLDGREQRFESSIPYLSAVFSVSGVQQKTGLEGHRSLARPSGCKPPASAVGVRLPLLPPSVPWCNGSTAVCRTVGAGSNPVGTAMGVAGGLVGLVISASSKCSPSRCEGNWHTSYTQNIRHTGSNPVTCTSKCEGNRHT